ncbi:PTS lactose/cellobiose transporter subunit IIA, partial [Xenorhabdus sp. 12]
INEAHHFQTELIQSEARGEKTEISVLLIHAQDHLMNAITVKELAEEFITLHKRVEEKVTV